MRTNVFKFHLGNVSETWFTRLIISISLSVTYSCKRIRHRWKLGEETWTTGEFATYSTDLEQTTRFTGMRKAENPAGQACRDERICPWKYTWEKESPIVRTTFTRYSNRYVNTCCSIGAWNFPKLKLKNRIKYCLQFIVIDKEINFRLKIYLKLLMLICVTIQLLACVL